MRTIGHHTCSKDGGEQYVRDNAPFKSIRKEGYVPFLGEGYYYWDNNIGASQKWGKTHYKDSYFIIKSDLELPGEIFFDLVGNRDHMIKIQEHGNSFKKKNPQRKDWTVGVIIQSLKKLNRLEEYKGIFPYQAIRAIDTSKTPPSHATVKFVEGKEEYTNLAPILDIPLILTTQFRRNVTSDSASN